MTREPRVLHREQVVARRHARAALVHDHACDRSASEHRRASRRSVSGALKRPLLVQIQP